MKAVLATFNRDKARELAALLHLLGLEVVSLADVAPAAAAPQEDGATLIDNARIKARAALAATGLPAIADDTGLEVDALEGAPGVHAARFAGPDASYADNVRLLLERLTGVPLERRRARFRTVCSMVFPDGTECSGEGTLEGSIATAPRGANGFGYDPVFEVDGLGRTLAELDELEKNAVSHRGRAVRALAAAISALPGLQTVSVGGPAVVFGTPGPGEIDRPASYAIVLDPDGRVAVVEEDGHFHLPGGGAEPDESPEQALVREVREELGRALAIVERLPMVREHFEAKGRRYRMDARFFLAEFTGPQEGRGEYELRWEPPSRLEACFARACHGWGVREALARRRRE